VGTGALADKRLVIDFRRDQITISDSQETQETRPGVLTVAADLSHSRLVAINARVNGMRVKAIIDTGAASTIGNTAMRKLLRGAEDDDRHRDQIIGTVENGGTGRTYVMPPIELGEFKILGARVSFGDMPIFKYPQLSEARSLLLGMDILGRFGSMIIDYGAQQMQFEL